jgi:RNA polymerase primary sigma factor
LDDDEALTLEQIGARLGITRERVRQIRDRALRRMRRALPDHALSA